MKIVLLNEKFLFEAFILYIKYNNIQYLICSIVYRYVLVDIKTTWKFFQVVNYGSLI